MSLPISGFTAVPNPQMLAFMAAQSFIMMFQAGEGWQYGKRRQSAMTNEEFNKQTPLSIMQRQMSELKTAIPTIEKSMNAMTPMIRTIVTQYGDFVAEIIKSAPDIVTAAQGGQTLHGNISTVGKEFADILKGLASAITANAATFGTLPKASATLVTNNPQYTPPPSPPSADEYAHTLGTHAGHTATAGTPTTISGPVQGPPAPDTRTVGDITPLFSDTKGESTTPSALAWIQKRDHNIREFLRSKNFIIQNPNHRDYSNNVNRGNHILRTLRDMSDDYRHPNNFIRTSALALRKLLATAQMYRLS